MTYHLSINVIIDTIHALAAAQALSLDEHERGALQPLLDRERQGLLRLLVKNAFAETVMSLGPLVTETALDAEDASTDVGSTETGAVLPDVKLVIGLRVPTGFSATRHGVVRRALEQLIAHSALAAWCRTLAPDHSETFSLLCAQWHNTLAINLAPVYQPMLRVV